MKGLELSINIMVYVLIGLLVILAAGAFFMSTVGSIFVH